MSTFHANGWYTVGVTVRHATDAHPLELAAQPHEMADKLTETTPLPPRSR